MIKKIVCAALTTALLISSAVGVMAAGYTYSTTTTYGSDGIVVSSTVSGVAVGDTLTYLAWEETDDVDGMADDEVVYIDQIVADATEETFTYAADTADINAKVLYGGKTAAGAAMPLGSGTVIPGMISVYRGDTLIAQGCASDKGEDYVKVEYLDGQEPGTAVTAIYTLTAVEGSGLSEVNYVTDCFAANDGLWISADALDADGETVLYVDLQDDNLVYVKTYDIKKVDNKLVVLAQAIGSESNYGVYVSTDDFATIKTAADYDDENSATAKTVKYAAAGANAEGAFLIELDYDTESIPEGEYKAKAYGYGQADSVTDAAEVLGEAVGPVVVGAPAAQ